MGAGAMGSYSEMQDFVTITMVLGGALALFGLGSAYFSSREGDSGGLGIPIGLVGLGLVLVGFMLGNHWGVL